MPPRGTPLSRRTGASVTNFISRENRQAYPIAAYWIQRKERFPLRPTEGTTDSSLRRLPGTQTLPEERLLFHGAEGKGNEGGSRQLDDRILVYEILERIENE